MQTNQNYEPEIHLRDCFFHVLYHWRSILLVTLVAAVLLGGYTWLTNRNVKSSSKTQTETAETQATQAELKQSAAAGSYYNLSNDVYEQLLKNGNDYRDHSLLMGLDPYNVWVATSAYGVVMEESAKAEASANGITQDPAFAVAALYPLNVDYQGGEAEWKQIYGEDGFRDIRDLVSCTYTSGSKTITLRAVGSTEEMAKDALSVLEKQMIAFSGAAGKEMGAHHLVRLSGSTMQTSDDIIESRQSTFAKNVTTYQNAVTSNVKSITNTQKTASSSSSKTKKKSVWKYAGIGAGAGFLGMAIFWVLAYMFSGALRESEVLTRKYGLALYGDFQHSRARHPGKGLDGLIEKWEFRGGRKDKAVLYDSICSMIPEDCTGTILLTGTVKKEKLTPVFEALSGRMKGKANLVMEADLNNNSAAVLAAGKADAVLVVEEKHVTRDKELAREAEILSICGTPVLGAIVI